MMPMITNPHPLSLYIHIPWCVKKCPYCDFNSHAIKDTLPEQSYVDALLKNIDQHWHLLENRSIQSIFFGGGTPSLFSGAAIETLLSHIARRFQLTDKIEITLEANPGTVDQSRFIDFYRAGINRLSIGIQSFQNTQLRTLGRIHDGEQAKQAVISAKAAGFTNFNIDLMHGLPEQTYSQALQDLETAIQLQPTHLSWYQLTIEPNTLFYHQPPTLPTEDVLWEIQESGQAFLSAHGFNQYEVSAYAKGGKECLHNLNYWQFGDYLGIGAGAYSKLTLQSKQQIIRFSHVKHPKDYLMPKTNIVVQEIAKEDVIFEFMLNALRLTNGVPLTLFEARTGIPHHEIRTQRQKAIDKGLLIDSETHLKTTALGRQFLNDLTALFLPY